MPKIITHEQFVKDMSEINPNIQILGKYTNNKAKILCMCKIHNVKWEVTPHHLKEGQGCKQCGISQISKNNQKKVIEKLSIVNPDIVILSFEKVDDKHILVTDKKCGHTWKTTPTAVLHGSGCPTCNRLSQRKTHEQFVQELNIIHPNIVILNQYITGKTRIECLCTVDGHTWNAKANNLLSGYGCPVCGRKRTGLKKRKTNEQFTLEMSLINPDIELLEPYTTCHSKIKCKCKLDGYEWYGMPSNLLRKEGCPLCCASKGEKEITKYLKESKLEYQPQIMFDGLLGVGNGKLSYDFYIPQYNLLIEYQGEQHFESVEHFGGEEQLLVQQEHDKKKREYAYNNGYNLLEISYTDINNIYDIITEYISNIKNPVTTTAV